VIREIAGRQNHSVKLARKLQKKKHRRERGLLVGEGMDVLRAAVDAGAHVQDVLVRRDLVGELPSLPDADIGICDEETLEYVSSLGGAVDVIFVCREPSCNLADLELGDGVTFYLDAVGDPGNVGTLVRGCFALGAGGLVCSPGSADPYSPKAMRAGMGAQFALPIVVEVSGADLKARLAGLAAKGAVVPRVLVADPYEGEDVRVVSLEAGAVVVLGAERNGPGAEWARAERITVRQGRFDSLNVAMAGTIIAYELCRDRGGK
jgi:RNA methyltransferase, TrmH family